MLKFKTAILFSHGKIMWTLKLRMVRGEWYVALLSESCMQCTWLPSAILELMLMACRVCEVVAMQCGVYRLVDAMSHVVNIRYIDRLQ